MNWNHREAARALNMSEREVLRLAREGEVPAFRVNDHYMFNPADLQEWGARRNHKMAPDVMPRHGEPRPLLRLADAVERGGVYHDLAGTNRNEVLNAAAHVPGVPPHIDRALLAEVLRGREALASTGIGGGIAIPHPRDPIVLEIERPIIILCFLCRAVDFQSIDGRPVRVLFTLLSPTIPLHLRLLSRLAYALHDDILNRLLDERADRDAIVARLRELDSQMDDPAAEIMP